MLATAQYHLGGWTSARKAVDTALRQIENRSLPDTAVATAHLLAAVLAVAPGVDLETRLLYLAVAQAAAARARGDYPAMLAAFDEIKHLLRAMPENGRPWAPSFSWRPLFAEVLVEAGDVDAARRELRVLDRLAEQTPHLRMAALWLSGRLAERGGDVRRAQRYYEQAVTLTIDRNDTPLSRAQAELAFGRMLRRTGDSRREVLWLLRARQRFLRLGATPCRASRA